MKILGPHIVMMNPDEKTASIFFEEMIDNGHDILTSAARTEEAHPGLDPAFYRWLRDEPLLPPGKYPGAVTNPVGPPTVEGTVVTTDISQK